MTTWNLFILLNEEAKFVNGDGPLEGYCAAALGEEYISTHSFGHI